jgi:hypothetical protein
MQQCIKIFIISYLHKAQHVSGNRPPIIRSLKLHWQPLVYHTWKVVKLVAGGRCQAVCLTTATSSPSNNLPRIQKPEAARAVLSS